MSEHRVKIDEKVGRGTRFELYEFRRKIVTQPVFIPGANGQGGTALTLPAAPTAARTLRVVLEGGAALLEPGALQFAHGKLTVDVQKADRNSSFFSRAVASAGTGEAGHATRYAGYGEVWTEPTSKHFIIAEMDGPADALILDDRAFYACEGGIEIKPHVHRTLSGMLSGNGFMQPKLEGAGVFVVESPVPVEEIEVVELDGSGELIVDGDLMMMYSASLQCELKPLVRGLRNALRSGEGLVFTFRGRGTVWLTPTMRLGH